MEEEDTNGKEPVAETSLTSFNGMDGNREEEEEADEPASKIEEMKAKQSGGELGHQTSEDEADETNGHNGASHENGNGETEAQVDVNGEQEAKSLPPHTKSVDDEFSYTSLGAGVDESVVDEANESKVKVKQQNGLAEVKVEEAAAAAAAALNEADTLKSLPFDTIIEKVKANKAKNKEVCTYVLNLLVGGEFDLEKNFVIQNVKSIMNMIQVIKCAQPQLKVEVTMATGRR